MFLLIGTNQDAAGTGQALRFVWEIPGGGLDRDEEPMDAAYRELHEETGIMDNELENYFHFHQLDIDSLLDVDNHCYEICSLFKSGPQLFINLRLLPNPQLYEPRLHLTFPPSAAS